MNWKQKMLYGLEQWITICSDKDHLQEIKKQLLEIKEDAEDKLSVMVMGEFKAGKSTFLNAMIGQEILTADVTPATAVVTKLKYGERQQVIGHFLSGEQIIYDYRWLDQLTAEREGEFADIRRSLAFVELQMPLEILKTFTIIDTPGLNANELHTAATERFLQRADITIWLFNYRNAGTSTELEWIKKLNDQKINPIAIINGIDLHDEEEEELEEFLDFTYRRLYPLVESVIGVSAKDALKGKIQKDKEKLKWSNWSEMDGLFSNLEKVEERKAERIFQKLIKPIDQLRRILRSELSSFSLQDTYPILEHFMTWEFSESQQLNEEIHLRFEQTKQVIEQWENQLKINIQSIEDLEQYIENITIRVKNENKLSYLWNHIFLVQFKQFNEKISDFELGMAELIQTELKLENNWYKVKSSNFMFKIERLQKHAEKVASYDSKRKTTLRIKDTITDISKQMEQTTLLIEQEINSIIQEEINESIFTFEKEAKDWNNYLANMRRKYVDITLPFTQRLETYFDVLAVYKRAVFVPILDSGQEFGENKIVKNACNLIIDSKGIPNLSFNSLVERWQLFDSFSHTKSFTYHLEFPLLRNSYIKVPELPVPSELNHNTTNLIRQISKSRNKWLLSGVAASVISAGVYSYSMEMLNDYETVDPDTWEDNEVIAGEPENVVDEPETETADDMPELDSTDLLNYLEKMKESRQHQFNHADWFNEEGWANYSSFDHELKDIELFSMDLNNVDYLRENEYGVTTEETYIEDEVEKRYVNIYSISQLPNGELIITEFANELLTEVEIEIGIEDDVIEDFIAEFWKHYVSVTNQEVLPNLTAFVNEDSDIYSKILSKWEVSHSSGHVIETLEFQVNAIESAGVNLYKISTYEYYTVIDDMGEKNKYQVTNEYLVKVFPDSEPEIMDMTVLDTQTEKLIDVTTDLVTEDQVQEFITNFYLDYVYAYNGKGFTSIGHYLNLDSNAAIEIRSYLEQATGLSMSNHAINVNSIRIADEVHYEVSLDLENSYSYDDGTSDIEMCIVTFKIFVVPNGTMLIDEIVSVEIKE